MRTVRVIWNERAAIGAALWLSAALCAGACARPAKVARDPVAAGPATAAPAADTTAPAAASSASPGASGNLLVSETEYQGWRYYHVYCARCHGQDALGTLDAPNLRYSITEEGGVPADSFMVIVRHGSDNEEMPPFHELLDDAQIRNVYAYLKARSDGRLAVGRPRRATPPP